MAWWRQALFVLGAALLLAAPAAAQQALSREARAAVAEAMYAASSTSAASERAADARLMQQRQEIERLQAQLASAGGRNAEIEAEIAAAQERYVADLARLDRAYAAEIAVYRRAVEDIAATPEGERALRRFNAGDEIGALAALDEIRAANDAARRARSEAEDAADMRRIAMLSLERQAQLRLNPGGGSGMFLQDAFASADDAADQMLLNGDLDGARRRYEQQLPGAAPAHQPILLERLGDIDVARGQNAAARTRYAAALAAHRAVSDGLGPARRAEGLLLYKLARLPGGGVTWREVSTHFEAMRSDGVLPLADQWIADDLARRAAAR